MRPVASIQLATALLAVTACGEPAAVRCDDDTYCPADTRCGSGGLCLVDDGACSGFTENTPCVLADGDGFCAGQECRAGVSVSGRVIEQGGGPLGAATVEAVDRPWMQAATTDENGQFTMTAVAGDRLVLRIDAQDGYPPLRTRDLALGDDPYALNGDREVALRVIRAQKLVTLLAGRGLELDPSQGFVVVAIGLPGGIGVDGGRASLVGPGSAAPIYFARDGSADFDRTETTAQAPIALFVGVEPGRHTLPVSHDLAERCFGTGTDAPEPIELEVAAGELTSAGWATCTVAGE